MSEVETNPQPTTPVEPASTQTPLTPAPAAPTNAEEPAKTGEPTAKENKTPYVFRGDMKELEEKAPQLVEYAKGVQRHLTQRSQEVSSALKKAKAYDQFVNSPHFNAVQEFLQTKISEDPVQSQIQQLQLTQLQMQKKQELQQFADANPDFMTFHELGIMTPIIREVVDIGGGTLEEAYQVAQSLVSSIEQRASEKALQRTKEKLNASSIPPTTSSEGDVVYVSSDAESRRVALELASKGIKKRVEIRAPERRK